MKFSFKNNVEKVYDEEDSLIILEFLKLKPAEVIKINEYTDEEMDALLKNLYEREPICIGCDEEYHCGAGGYCSSCWVEVFGCEDEYD
jgi:hypothetical protein